LETTQKGTILTGKFHTSKQTPGMRRFENELFIVATIFTESKTTEAFCCAVKLLRNHEVICDGIQ
jgi:hypothetical protein